MRLVCENELPKVTQLVVRKKLEYYVIFAGLWDMVLDIQPWVLKS